jgi:peptidoglycan/xylan/chitin deacetylase (PgdA/CDA1 family)
VLSFDVGYHSVYANALPVLRERRWPGVLFLQASQTEADFPAQEVKALVDAGWELDSHGLDGTQLTGLPDGEVLRQAQESRRELREAFRAPVRFFSYPGGAFDQRVATILESAGYRAAFTSDPGLARPKEPPYALSRIVLRNGDGADGLQRALEQAAAQ